MLSRFWILLAIPLTLAALAAEAHPVSYKNAFGVMSYNSQDSNELLVNYSLNSRFAVAATYLREEKSEFYIPRLNLLVQRWNNEDSQGNFYLSAGAGAEKFDSKNYDTGLLEVILDWESRKYYTYFEHQYFARKNENNPTLAEKDLQKSKLRLGFAPFLADYSDLNVWYIAEFNQSNTNPQIAATQFLRFYMKNVLWEVGAGFDGSIAFNFMIHL
ncbi:hypothetical protein [Bdellovibrio sp. HCB337]|uniref:hypothetical protein n=1 Tax=Bdellovibrio sp. HCB337 TaxID=3394358 RepID=UPI0039A4A267